MSTAVSGAGSGARGHRIGIVGLGAVGGHFAAQLAAAGHEVSALATSSSLAALRAHGLRHRSLDLPEKIYRINVCATAEEMGRQDLVILALKAQVLPSVAASLKPLMGAETVLLPVGNGLPWWYFLVEGVPLAGTRLTSVDPDRAIERALPIGRVLGASFMGSCHSPAPGVVVHVSGGKVTLGEPGGGTSERASYWTSVLTEAGLPTTEVHNIREALWLKLLGNIGSNPISLLTGTTTDRIVDDGLVRTVFQGVMQECLDVGKAIGLALDISVVDRIAQTRALGSIKSSMLQDLEAGRSVELDAIVRAPMECATALGMEVPFMQAIFGLARLRAQALDLYPA